MGIKDARLLAISSKGELAVALTPQLISTLLAPGNLARTTGSSAPKPEIENIQAADFTPDGSALAIVRYVPADFKCQLEYPIGKVLYRERLIDDVRFSANGKYLAFISHTNPSDDRGTVMILRTTGEKVAASPLYESSQGLAWSVGGDEVWTSSPLESGEVHALSISGKTREPLAMPGRLHLRDISSKGQLLVGQGIARRGIVVSSNHGESLRDLSWLDFSFLRDISDDGKMILFEEEGSSTTNYTVYVRDADGSPAVPIGEGYASALSRDKKWALAIKLTEPNHEIWLLPVGPGEPRRVNPPNLVPANVLPRFLSDGSRIVYSATEVGQKFPRIWLQNLNDGSPKPISPEGVLARNVSPDDKWVLVFVRDTTGKGQPGVLSIEGGNPVEITGLKPAENPLGWTSDGQLYVASADTTGAGVKVAKLNPHTGARTPWRVLATAPIGGVIPDPPIITPDGNSYGFDYRVRLSDLYTVTGVR
jgi:Tol biopolymer transport system component